MSNIKTLTYPQVAILWWNESKQSHADYLSSPFFTDPDSRDYVTNGQLVLVDSPSVYCRGSYIIALHGDEADFIASERNLIFLGEL